jgi:formylglycine-generating enzyme required for sulfatase activity
MAQGGNVFEWNETAFDGINDTAGENRVLRGGSWDSPYSDYFLYVSVVGQAVPGDEGYYFGNIGFRVASVPEPSSLSLLAIGLGGLTLVRRRK